MKVRFRIFAFLALMALLAVVLVTKKAASSEAACSASDLSGEIDPSQKVAVFEGKEVPVPEIALDSKPPVLGVSNEERWIEINLSEQKLKAWEGNNLFLETLISTGLPWTPTPKGTFYIKAKFRAIKMEGGVGSYYYYLPNVPFVMFFGNDSIPWSKGYSLHGTYWHHDFGRVHSHGCVNLPTPVAEKLYWWTNPQPQARGIVRADESNPGTRIVIHD